MAKKRGALENLGKSRGVELYQQFADSLSDSQRAQLALARSSCMQNKLVGLRLEALLALLGLDLDQRHVPAAVDTEANESALPGDLQVKGSNSVIG